MDETRITNLQQNLLPQSHLGKQDKEEAGKTQEGTLKESYRRFINQNDGQVIVSFQLSCHDWNLLKKSAQWNFVEKYLEENRSKHIQKNPLIEKGGVGL